MRMRKRQFRIGELANRLKIERFIIRFWEKEFSIKTNRSQGRQRYYDEYDLEKFTLIKQLLYERGFTIAGAKREIEGTKYALQRGTPSDSTDTKTPISEERIAQLKQELQEQRKQFETQVGDLKDQLRQLRDIL